MILILSLCPALLAEEREEKGRASYLLNWYNIDSLSDRLSSGPSETMAPTLWETIDFSRKDNKGHIIVDRASVLATDENNDGTMDSWKYTIGEEPVLIENDNDADGVVDVWRFYEKKSLRRLEVDRNHDMKPDMISHYDRGQKTRLEIDQNLDGIIDRRSFYENGRTVKMEWDSDFDGVMDKGFDRSGGLGPNRPANVERRVTYPMGPDDGTGKGER